MTKRQISVSSLCLSSSASRTLFSDLALISGFVARASVEAHDFDEIFAEPSGFSSRTFAIDFTTFWSWTDSSRTAGTAAAAGLSACVTGSVFASGCAAAAHLSAVSAGADASWGGSPALSACWDANASLNELSLIHI